MRAWLPRIVVLLLLGAIVGVPLAMHPPVGAAPGDEADRLIVLTPHNEQIRSEMEHGFNRWRRSQKLPAVMFDWRSWSTADLRRQVLAELAAAVANGRVGIGKDLSFGGGQYDHDELARGVPVPHSARPTTSPARISAVVPIDLSPALINEVYPERMIGDQPLYDPQLRWVGAALASFGIVYNRDVLRQLGTPDPTAWADLADPRYRTWVALGDPAPSASVAIAYNAVLRRMGWSRGWATLRRISANARSFTNSGPKVPVDVSSGEAAAGMCIDFYGRFQAGVVEPFGSTTHSGVSRVGYIDPPGMTATTVDPISLLRGAPHRAVAEQFIRWLLSVDGQSLWQKRLGAVGGPERYELRRMPIRRDLYTPEHMRDWTDAIDPFTNSRSFTMGIDDLTMIAPITHAMAIDVHDDLTAAWEAINRLPASDPLRVRMEAQFDVMPAELTFPVDGLEDSARWKALVARYRQPDGRDALLVDRQQWTAFFSASYRKVTEMR